MVLEFIHGTTMSISRLCESGVPTRMAASLKQLHGGPRFLRDFDMFRLTDYYLGIVREHQVTILGRYPEYMPRVREFETAFKNG